MDIEEKANAYIQHAVNWRLQGCDDDDANFIQALCHDAYIAGYRQAISILPWKMQLTTKRLP